MLGKSIIQRQLSMFPKTTHILIVDDSANIRRMIVDALGRMDFIKLTTAEDSNDALGKLKHFHSTPNPIGLILCDLNMPGPSGLDLLKTIRKHAHYSEMPFVLVTTESEKTAVAQAAMSGVSAYIVKPFNMDTLAKRLWDTWKKHNPEAA